MNKKVITYGTFDLFHIGHVRLLERLAALGDHLTVCVSTDAFNASKGKRAVMSYAQRAELVSSCRFVDKVLPEKDWAQKRSDILREEIDIFAIGDDWTGKFDDLQDICEVVYMPRTQDISTTALKQVIMDMQPAHIPQEPGGADQAAAEAVSTTTFQAILDTAREGRLDKKSYKRFLNLLTRNEDRSNTDWLRCWILLHCLMQKKSMKTQGYISKYNRMSHRWGKVAEYEAFMQLLFTEMALLRPINGKYTRSFGPGDISPILTECKSIMEQLAVYEREIFTNSGTLLGLVRNGTLLAHDDDIDLGVLLQANTEAEAAEEWLELTDRMIADGLAVKRSDWSRVTLKLHKIGAFGVDLFPAWSDASGRLYIFPHTYGTLTRDQLLPLHRHPLTGLAVPHDAEAILASNYGEDWRVPNEGWRFDWTTARKNFAGFLARL